jgi:hypothetical protein
MSDLLGDRIEAILRRLEALEAQEDEAGGGGGGSVTSYALARLTDGSSSAFAVTDATDVTVDWDAEAWDTGAYWTAGTPSRLTVTEAGLYRIAAQTSWSVGGTDYPGFCNMYIVVNGDDRDDNIAAQSIYSNGGVAPFLNCAVEYELEASDYVELIVRRETGIDTELVTDSGACWFSIAKIG